MTAQLATGDNAGTVDWTLNTGDQVLLTLDFNFSSLSSGNGFSYFLRGGSTTMYGFRVRGNGANGPQVQLMSDQSTGSFAYLADTPTLSLNTWYRLTVGLEIVDENSTLSSLMIEQLGTGGGVIYDQDGFALNSTVDFGSATSLVVATSLGTPTFATANIQMSAIPEPTSAMLVMGSGLLGAFVLRNRRRQA